MRILATLAALLLLALPSATSHAEPVTVPLNNATVTFDSSLLPPVAEPCRILEGPHDPDPAAGKACDYWRSTTSNLVWGPKAESWPASPINPPLPPSAPVVCEILKGDGEPAPGLGKNCDIFVSTKGFAWGPKVDNQWPTPPLDLHIAGLDPDKIEGVAVIQLALNGTAEWNTQQLQAAINSGKNLYVAQGKVNIIPPIKLAQHTVLICSGASRNFGTTMMGTVFIPRSGTGAKNVFEFTTGNLFSGRIENCGMEGKPGEYDGYYFNGFGNVASTQNLRIRGVKRGVVLANAHNSDQSAAWVGSLRDTYVDLNTGPGIHIIRDSAGTATGGMATRLLISGYDHPHPMGGRPLEIHWGGEFDTAIKVENFSWVLTPASSSISAPCSAAKITSTRAANVSFDTGGVRGVSGDCTVNNLKVAQSFIEIDRADHMLSINNVQLKGNPVSPAWPDFAIRVTSDASKNIPAVLADGRPVAVTNGRIVP